MEGKKEYRDCPIHCIKSRKKKYDVFRDEYCDECQHKIQLKKLERDTEQLWVKWLGDKLGEKQKFKWVFGILNKIQTLKRSALYEKGELTTKASLLIDVYTIEESWFKDKNA